MVDRGEREKVQNDSLERKTVLHSRVAGRERTHSFPGSRRAILKRGRKSLRRGMAGRNFTSAPGNFEGGGGTSISSLRRTYDKKNGNAVSEEKEKSELKSAVRGLGTRGQTLSRPIAVVIGRELAQLGP